MVFMTSHLLAKLVKPLKHHTRPEARSFIDNLAIIARSGRGGNGSKQFGGIGGRGGHVIVKGSEGGDLSIVRRQSEKQFFKASHGGHAAKNQLLGKSGEDCIVRVPLGVRVKDGHQRLIGEINEEGKELIIARGGSGGCLQTNFAGHPGETTKIKLDLQLVADIGLLGFPNAGKSTLLKSCSNAKPKIASYPFTTLRPRLATLDYPDLRRITMADLPGLIEGAHRNEGMGHRFLRHLERTKLILLLADITGFQLNVNLPHRTVLETLALLNKEMELYNPDLLQKPIILVINKMDLPEASTLLEELKGHLENLPESFSKLPEEMRPEIPIKFCDVHSISAIGERPAVDGLRNRLREILDEIWLEDQNLVGEDEERLNKLRRFLKQSGPELR